MQQSPFTESELAGIKGFDGMIENIQSLAITINTAISSNDPSQRAEDSADVSCFLNSSFALEIERGEYEKVSGFLQLLRKKFERHQQVSHCSKRIFKPPSREKRIWMANHLKAMRQMQLVYKPGPEPEPKYRPSKRHSQINYGLYQPRTKMIMERAMAMKPVSSMIAP